MGSVGFAKTPPDFTEALWTASQKSGLFITVDEVQDASPEEMRRFGNEIQLLVRRGANIAFAFAGLPSAVDRVVNGRGLTFLQRAKQVSLARLERYQVQDSLEMTVRSSGMEIVGEVAAQLAQAAAGYPYMVQLVGYHAWQAAVRRGAGEIADEDARWAIARARCDFDAMVIAPALRRLPAGQIEYLVAMAQCEGTWVSSGEVAQAMGRTTKDVSTFRKRLIDASLIESPGYGRVGFAIPYMRDYLVRNAASLQEDLGARWRVLLKQAGRNQGLGWVPYGRVCGLFARPRHAAL